MKKTTATLFGLLLSASLIAGCAGVANKSDTGAVASKGAATAPAGDLVISQKVNAALAADPQINAQDLNVTAANGKVTLKGQVKSVQAFQKATALAKQVPGVIAVDNRIVVCITCK